MAALSDGQRSASARTREDSVLITIFAHDLQASMHASTGLYKRMMRMMADRMKEANLKLLKKEQQLSDIEKTSWRNIESVAAHLSAKQELLKELSPFISSAK